MSGRAGRRGFGAIRKLPSGRYQVRYLAPDGLYRSAPQTFATRTDADRFLAKIQADMDRGSWIDPDLGRATLHAYAERWLADRTSLRPRTRELYAGLLTRHVLPELGEVRLRDLAPAMVRSWHARLSSGQRPGPVTVAKSYRLLRAILATAVEDELIARNPCLVKGGGIERSPERPVATVEQVYRLADVVPYRFRALVLLAAFTGLRWGELAALARCHLDLDADPATVRVERTLVEPDHGPAHLGPPKTAAGRRTVAIPAAVVPELRRHRDTYAAPGPGGLVFCGATGAMLSRRNFHTQIRWKDATRRAGLDGLHFHDLRHIANTLAAATGASTRELMARMGHASTRTAMIYQHATGDRDAAIARAVDELLTAARRTTP